MWASFKAWLDQPYSADMTALDWFKFIGLLIVISGLWAIILRHIRSATS